MGFLGLSIQSQYIEIFFPFYELVSDLTQKLIIHILLFSVVVENKAMTLG